MKKLTWPYLLLLLCCACSGVAPQAATPVYPSATPQPAYAPGPTNPEATHPSTTPAALIHTLPGLTGKLILIAGGDNGSALNEIDLATGKSKVLFQAPPQSWLSAESISPDGKLILLAYSPPPPGGQVTYGFTDLYMLPADGSVPPSLYLERADPQESFFDPTWSPDGKMIYYAHFFYTDIQAGTYTYQVERIGADKVPEIVVKNASWPQLSPDGKKMAFLSFDPSTRNNELYLAGADGQNPSPILAHGMFPVVDAHMFSPDGRTITFSAVNSPSGVKLFWWEKLLGIEIASAHDLPSDWYRVAVDGGQAQRLTNLNDTGMYGHYSPDGKHIAFISSTGLTIMDANGGSLAQVSSAAWLGTLDWIP